MNNYLNSIAIYLFLATGSLSVFAQSTFTISGNIKNASATSMQLFVLKNHFAPNPESLNSEIKNGDYKFTVKIDKPLFASLTYKGGGLKIYVEPGDDINISFTDDEQHSNTALTGKGADNNQFYSAFSTQFAQFFSESVIREKIMSQSVDAFENYLFSIKKSQTEALSSYADLNKLSPTFVQFIKNEIEYQYWNFLFAYPIIRANSNAQILQVEPLPALMLDNFQKVQLNNEDALVSDSYRGFIYYYVVYFTSAANKFQKFNDYSTAAERKLNYARIKLQGDVFNSWLAQFCLDEKSHVSPFMIKKMVTALKESDKGLKYYPFVNTASNAELTAKEEKKETNQKIAAASKTDELGLTDVNGKSFSLSDLKGKVVYIDFWASWCGPCKGMMPYSKQLHESLNEVQKKQIVFLYISIDADTARWKQGIKELGIEGVNVNSPGNWGASVCRYFQINSIPRYMIMNKKGDIVDFNAKRPADQAVLQDLLMLAD